MVALAAGLLSSIGTGPSGAAKSVVVKTHTTVFVPNPTHAATTHGMVPITATVSMVDLNGVLITPSGSVAFSVGSSNGPVKVGTASLSNCLLGLPSILGIWQDACSATLNVPGSDFNSCGFTVVTGTYSGATDIAAGPSSDTVTVAGKGCTPPPS